jgi:dTDP-glucose pyrophosphorylase
MNPQTADHPKIIILAGGSSSRMRRRLSVYEKLPPGLQREALEKSKSMIGVGASARPFLDYLLYNIQTAGYREVVIIIGEGDTTIHRYYAENGHAGEFPDLRLAYVAQRIPAGRQKPLGTADALYCAMVAFESWRDTKFTVCNSDNLYSVEALRLLLFDSHANAMIDYDRNALMFDAERISQFSVIEKDRHGYLTDIVEKPSSEQMKNAGGSTGRIGVSMNVFRFSYDDIFPYLSSVPLHPVRNEKELPIAVKLMIQDHPQSVFTIPLSEHVIDLTTPNDIPAVQEYLKLMYPHFTLSPGKK